MGANVSIPAVKYIHLQLAKLYIEAARSQVELKREKAAAVTAFTFGKDVVPLYFAGPHTVEQDRAYVFISGEGPFESACKLERPVVERLPKLSIILRREQDTRVIQLCDEAKDMTDRPADPSPFLVEAFRKIALASDVVNAQVLQQQQAAPPSSPDAPFGQLALWLDGAELTSYLTPAAAMSTLRGSTNPRPYFDAEQQQFVSLFDRHSAASVAAAMKVQAVPLEGTDVILHLYTNLECCDYCFCFLLNSYYKLKDLYSKTNEFFITVSGHAQYIHPGKFRTSGIAEMHRTWPDEIVRKHVKIISL